MQHIAEPKKKEINVCILETLINTLNPNFKKLLNFLKSDTDLISY